MRIYAIKDKRYYDERTDLGQYAVNFIFQIPTRSSRTRFFFVHTWRYTTQVESQNGNFPYLKLSGWLMLTHPAV